MKIVKDLLPNRTYLIQRLQQPVKREGKYLVNPFSFGAGYSGLEKKIEETIAKIWSWDCMAAAEFENGIAQRVLKTIYEYSKLNNSATGSCTVDTGKEAYYLCRKEDEKGVKKTIKKLYSNEYSFHLKRPTYLKESFNEEEYLEKIAGWLELNNGFMFFKDKKMYERTLELFGIK
ncbi:MAG: hypothetical protein NTZ02_03760 [Candidatus Woesearchaeota archaeon]|nr:hypothetical protein [Candidatus Woesearchaeota archaeon]